MLTGDEDVYQIDYNYRIMETQTQYQLQLKQTCLITIVIILFHVSIVTPQSCNSLPFPKVIGGLMEDTYIRQITYNIPMQQLAAVGYTYDYQMRGDGTTSGYAPIIAFYSGATFSIQWQKVVDVFIGDSYFNQVAISANGQWLVTYMGNTNLFIFKTDGTIVNFISNNAYYTDIELNYKKRTILISSESTPNVYIMKDFVSGTSLYGHKITAFPYNTAAASPTWALKSYYWRYIGENNCLSCNWPNENFVVP